MRLRAVNFLMYCLTFVFNSIFQKFYNEQIQIIIHDTISTKYMYIQFILVHNKQHNFIIFPSRYKKTNDKQNTIFMCICKHLFTCTGFLMYIFSTLVVGRGEGGRVIDVCGTFPPKNYLQTTNKIISNVFLLQ